MCASGGVDTAIPSGEERDRAAMSSVRRIFCLMVTFHLFLSFILWVIHTQVDDRGWEAFERQVLDYTIWDSLFDTVVMAAVRSLFLLLAYGLFRLKNWWTVAISTFMYSAFLLTKVFLFAFGAGSQSALSYCVLMVPLVLAWVETLFLGVKVLGWENDQLQKLAAAPVHMSDIEDNDPETGGAASPGTDVPAPQLEEYRRLATISWNFLWDCLMMEDSEWKVEGGKSVREGVVHSTNIKNYGKIFKLEGEVDQDPHSLWLDLNLNVNSNATWNPTLIECSTVQAVDECTEITYIVAAGIGGVMPSRDFVTLRHWGVKEGIYLSAGHGVSHPDRPPVKKHVRGLNGPGGWAFKPVEGDPSKCIFVWVMILDLKIWMLQRLADQACTSVLLDYLKYLRRHVAETQRTT